MQHTCLLIQYHWTMLCHCSRNIYSCWPTNTAAVQICLLVKCHSVLRAAMPLQLQQICLLAKCNCHTHRCCSNMPTGGMLLQDGCLLDRCHSVSMPADLMPLNPACRLAWYFSIAIPAGMLPHYQP